MKLKLLLVSFTTLLSISLKAQDTTAHVIPDTVKVTLSSVYSDVKEGLKGLGDALKVGSEHVYSVLIKQQLVNSIVYLLLLLPLTFSISAAYRLSIFLSKCDNTNDYSGHIAGCISCFILSATLCIAILINLPNIITGFINPEYGAIKDIIEFIKPK